MRFTLVAIPLSFAVIILFFFSSCVDRDNRTGTDKRLKVVCLGDSITYGYKLKDPANESYPARLQEMSHGRWQVLNLGVNGATVLRTGDIPIIRQPAYERALHSRPDVVVLMLGTNDIKDINWKHINLFKRDYIGLLSALQTLPSHPYVIACSIPPILIDYPNGLTRERQQKINILISSIVSQVGVDFLNVYSALAGKSSLFVDGIHPNAAGAQCIATLVFERISTLKLL